MFGSAQTQYQIVIYVSIMQNEKVIDVNSPNFNDECWSGWTELNV